MCGIVYGFRTDGKPAAKRILKRYKRQSARGTDGFGYVAINDDSTVAEYKRAQSEGEISQLLRASDSKHILFHHRFPTSTVNVAEAAHPILVKHSELKHSYYVVHNGVINNSEEIREKHIKLGYRYTTEIQTSYRAGKKVYAGSMEFNDSEALAIELARTIEGLQPMVETTGTIATIVLQCDKAGKKVQAMYYGTNGGNPLTITEDDAGIVIASEGGKAITPRVMFRYTLETGITEMVDVKIPVYSYPTTTGSYSRDGYNWQKDWKEQDEEESYQPTESEDEASLEDELAEIQWQISVAKMDGNWEEYYDLKEQEEDLLYAIEEARRAHTIGF